jgi:hydrogenase-4 membrane subunit HyfE
MFDQLARPASPYSIPERRIFVPASLSVLATVMVGAKLLYRYAPRFPILVGVPLAAVMGALVVLWICTFKTYRRIHRARATPSLSADEDAALLQRYKTQMQCLMLPTLALAMLFVVIRSLLL